MKLGHLDILHKLAHELTMEGEIEMTLNTGGHKVSVRIDNYHFYILKRNNNIHKTVKTYHQAKAAIAELAEKLQKDKERAGNRSNAATNLVELLVYLDQNVKTPTNRNKNKNNYTTTYCITDNVKPSSKHWGFPYTVDWNQKTNKFRMFHGYIPQTNWLIAKNIIVRMGETPAIAEVLAKPGYGG